MEERARRVLARGFDEFGDGVGTEEEVVAWLQSAVLSHDVAHDLMQGVDDRQRAHWVRGVDEAGHAVVVLKWVGCCKGLL